MMQFKNAVFTANGSIDMEINHPVYGWIPFTATPLDLEPLSVELFNLAKTSAAPCGPVVPPVVYPPLPRSVFWLAALAVGVTKAGILSRIESLPDGADKERKRITIEETLQYRREDPYLSELALEAGITSEQLDALWLWAANGG
nr:hypothetical protein [uncultured Gellertiella sp.]